MPAGRRRDDQGDRQQLQSLAMLMFKLHGYGYTIAMVFFGVGLIVSGYLIARSSYFPEALGVLLVFAGAGYLVDCFARFLAPRLAALLFPWALVPGFLAELGRCGWLLIKGVEVPKWEATLAGSPG